MSKRARAPATPGPQVNADRVNTLNNYFNPALDAVRDLMDAEMSKCQLLCANCHARKTRGYAASTTEF